MEILIFDLDGTLDNNVFKHDQFKLNYVLNLMKLCIQNNGLIFIVTARRLNDFKSVNDLLCYNIPSLLTNYIKQVSPRSIRWIYYNNNIKDPTKNTVDLMIEFNVLNEFEFFLMKNKLDFINFNLGIQKMLHIEDIIHNLYNIYFKTSKIYFFDDSKYNLLAYQFYKYYINPSIDIEFYGGNDQPVF